ncbi:MAG: cob(I)yrinic acid a,c-diamide adenosyltransferase [Candidatus Cyclobacteriaceae bacterium M3_2C_046]
MKIYTKTGDTGETSLLGGRRLSKSSLRIEAYGTVDELNAYLGLLRDQEVNHKRLDFLINIQEKLFTIGSILANDPEKPVKNIPKILASDIEVLEKEIDQMELVLPQMKNFVLPGGHPAVSYCHVTRCICRRAERKIIFLSQTESVDEIVVRYLNRLSDYLFVLARMTTHELQIKEIPWKPKENK